ncbi:unnamed protein product, partial [marine sediment metagenome]
GIGRATYYRWRKDDSKFCALSDDAIHEGSLLINDMTESQLLSAIKDRNMTAIIFWLKHHHPAYETRVEIRAGLNLDNENLTQKQKAIIKEALVVGSEAIEKNIDTNIARRFKGRGMSWSCQGARNLMAFRLMYANGEFDSFLYLSVIVLQ